MENKPFKAEQAMSLEQRQQRDSALYSPKNCFNHSGKIKSVKDVLSLPSVSLSQFKKTYGKDWVIGYISMWVMDLNDKVQVRTKLSDPQIEFLAERIYETYPLKVTDLTLFFRNVKEGAYGEFYENLSAEKIMGWLKEYFDQRCEYAQMQSQSGHSTFKSSENMSPEEKIIFNENLEKVFKDVGKEPVKYKSDDSEGRHKNALRILVVRKSTQELKEYLINNDSSSQFYDEAMYQLVEQELDRRNNLDLKNKSTK